MREIPIDAACSFVRRCPAPALLWIGAFLSGGLAAQAANAPRPAPGEEYISAVVGGPVHPPQPAPARQS